ncbi:hypothetical protein [Candidatus Nasuia deltocephalinicola]|uniref:hypothetical protein n=1 Tax=Candidatus Nasuia deltocephalincola TaxID=1160784 RepID=UPI00216B185C|nr:hypothetical protein [Candidatus Nasuia deltocephalinicola]
MFKCLKFFKKILKLTLSIFINKDFYKKNINIFILKYLKNKVKNENKFNFLVNKKKFLIFKIKYIFFRFLLK